MATGRLNGVDLTTTSATSVYTCPVTTFSVVSVSICNRSALAVTVRLALTTTGSTPATTDYLEYDSSLSANGVLERTRGRRGSEWSENLPDIPLGLASKFA
jgi:hypothetical protein